MYVRDRRVETDKSIRTHINKTIIDHYFDQDELYPMQNLEDPDIRPQHALMYQDTYRDKDGSVPKVDFISTIGTNELGPIQPNEPYMYQRLHYGLENWTMFRLLPQIIEFDTTINKWFRDVAKGTIKAPHENAGFAPSLWTYYHTLPQWARESIHVRNVLMAFEYNKPLLDIRQKELALNYMCSILGPIEGRLLEVITEVAESRKLRMTMQLAKEMMAELSYYEIDIAYLGSDTEEEVDDKDKMMDSLMKAGLDEDDPERNLVMKAFNSLNTSDRDGLVDNRKKLYEEEMNIQDFEVELEAD